MIGARIFSFSSLPSTQDFALSAKQAQKARHGDVFLAYHQSAGKGQGRNRWESEKGKNLTFSFVLSLPAFPSKQAFTLMEGIALGVRDFVSAQLRECPVYVKWVNDLIVADKKIGGILIHTVMKGAYLDYAVVGIGLNLNQTEFPPAVGPAISLHSLTHIPYAIPFVLHELLLHLNRYLEMLKKNKYAFLHREYNAHLYRRGEMIHYRDEKNTREPLWLSHISEEGILVAKTRSQSELRIRSSDRTVDFYT